MSCKTQSLPLLCQCSSGTLTYIQSRCQEALSNLHPNPETGSYSLLALLPTTLQHCEEIHNEVMRDLTCVEHNFAANVCFQKHGSENDC